MDARTNDSTERLVRVFEITNKRGLHARAAHRLVLTIEQFDAEVTVSKDGSTVVGTSIMGLLMLCASKGTSVEVAASGKESDTAMDAVATLIGNRFGED
ncbi:MAG: HPr family phosphocarrier protein [Pseudomonadota bacterium]